MQRKSNKSKELVVRKSQLIYRFIRTHNSVSKQGIVVGLKLSLPTVTQNLQYLTERGLIDTSLRIKNTGGRNATAYTYVRDTKMAIGIYLMANHMAAVAVDLSGDVVAQEKCVIKFDLNDDNYLKKIGEIVEMVKDQAGMAEENLLGVGIAVQSLVTEDGERIIYGKTLAFDITTRAEIAKYVSYRNRLFHDSEAVGAAEVWVDPNIKNAFYIILNNSVGGAVLVDNNIYAGDTLKGGEIGHMIAVREGGEQCYCGRYGCIDTVLRATKLGEYTNGDLAQFFVLLRQGDTTAAAMWDTYLNELAFAIHNIRMLFDGLVIIGGYVGNYIGDYLETLAEKVDNLSPFEIDRAIKYIRQCRYKVEAAAAGAAINYIQEFIDTI